MKAIAEKSIGLDGNVFVERRSQVRRRVFKGALLSFNKGYSSFDCIVRNMTEHGALLSVAENFTLPREFTLRMGGTARPAVVRWSSGSAIGIAFTN